MRYIDKAKEIFSNMSEVMIVAELCCPYGLVSEEERQCEYVLEGTLEGLKRCIKCWEGECNDT